MEMKRPLQRGVASGSKSKIAEAHQTVVAASLFI